MEIKKGLLAIYKGEPVKVLSTGKKIDIERQSGGSLSVRPKDIEPLMNYDDFNLKSLNKSEKSPRDAWELLQGESFSLVELCEIIFEDTTANSIYNTRLFIDRDYYFVGNGDTYKCRGEDAILNIEEEARLKEEEEKSFSQAISRLKAGKYTKDDTPFLIEIEEIALDQRKNSRVAKELGLDPDPVKAQAFLLRIGYWDIYRDPTPGRFHINMHPYDVKEYSIPPLNSLDLTYMEALAIDDEGSTDPDDAISLDSDGSLWIHITDIASLIKRGSQEDSRAGELGSNLYLPQETLRMLPLEVTTRMSLGAEEGNNTVSYKIEFDNEYNIVSREIHLAYVKVQRITYSDFTRDKYEEFYRIGEALKKRREYNGAISISLPEVKIRVDEKSINIAPLEVNGSREIISEFMLLAGESAAIFSRDNSIPIPYASQQPPDNPGKPESSLSSMYLWRRKFKRGETGFEAKPHSGLGLDLYTRATSPMRRYPDLIVNQQIRSFLLGEDLATQEDLMVRVMSSVENMRRFSQCERESNLHWKLAYLKKEKGDYKAIAVENKGGNKYAFLIPDLAIDTVIVTDREIELDSEYRVKVSKLNLPLKEVSFKLL